MSVVDKLTAICDKIRAKTKKTGKLGLDAIANSIDEVYNIGKEDYRTSFWNSYAGSTGVMNYCPYQFAGQGWRNTTFQPTKNLIFKGTATGLFRNCNIQNMVSILNTCGVTIDTSEVTNLQYGFAYSKITHLPKISLLKVGSNTDYMFAGTSGDRGRITNITELEIATNTTFKSNSFNYCTDLTHVIFTGTLTTNGLNISWSPLDEDSLRSLVSCLADKSSNTSTTWIITIGESNISTLGSLEFVDPRDGVDIIDGVTLANLKGWDVQ